VGASLIAVGVGAGYLDDASHFQFEFISDYSNVFGLGGLIGTLLSFIGCIGWARYLSRGHLVLMAVVVFAMPWAILLLGDPIAGTNVHGAAAPVMLLIIPATILTVVLLIMAALKL
jgi:hypothetical protein